MDNKYLIIHIKNKFEFFKFSQNESNNLINFELNHIFTYSPYDEEIFEIQNMLVLNKIDKLIFTKINKEENDLYEIFSLNINNNLKTKNIDIIDIKKNRILIKYFDLEVKYVFKFEIYNLKTRQLVLVFNKLKETKDLLFFDGKYIITLIYDTNKIYDINNFSEKKNIFYSYIFTHYKDLIIYPNYYEKCYFIPDKICIINDKNQIQRIVRMKCFLPTIQHLSI